MGLATHFGPWLLGTQKNTGVVSGTAVNRNIGATVCQTTTITYLQRILLLLGQTLVVIPGGALFLGGYIEYVISPYNGVMAWIMLMYVYTRVTVIRLLK